MIAEATQNALATVTPLHLDLPEITEAESRVLAQMHRAPIDGLLRFGGDHLRVAWTSTPSLAGRSGWHALSFDVDGVPGQLFASDRLSDWLLSQAQTEEQGRGNDQADRFDPPVAAMIAEHLLTAPLSNLEGKTGQKIRFRTLARCPDPDEPSTPLCFECEDASGASVGVLIVDHPDVLSLLKALGTEGPPSKIETDALVPLAAQLMSAPARIPKSDLEELRPGEALVFPAEWAEQDLRYIVIEDQKFAPVRVVGDGYTLSAEWSRVSSEWPIETVGTTGMTSDTQSPDTDDLTVTVSIEHDRKTMTVGEISKLGPGSLVTFNGAKAPEDVTLCVNGKAIASARLVKLSGEVAVQIVKML